MGDARVRERKFRTFLFSALVGILFLHLATYTTGRFNKDRKRITELTEQLQAVKDDGEQRTTNDKKTITELTEQLQAAKDDGEQRITVLTNQVQDVKDELDAVGNGDGSYDPSANSSIYEKGFNPVFIYSNATSAAAEIPSRGRSYLNSEPLNPIVSFSQIKQDKIIDALFHARTDETPKQLFFVDLAANHYSILSNTLALEQRGWNGLCIEGNQQYWYELARHRKCTIIGAYVGGKESDDGQQVQIAEAGVFTGIMAEGMDNEVITKKHVAVNRDIVSIITIFKETKTPKLIDYFSLDVEGAESLVMKDFPWDEYKFRILTIERPKDDLVAALLGQGYIFVAIIDTFGEEIWMHEKLAGISIDLASDIIKKHGPREITFERDTQNKTQIG